MIKRFAIILCILALIGLPVSCTAEEPGYSIVVDANGNTVAIDEASGALVSIDFEHYEVHRGAMFTVLRVEDLGNAAVYDILAVTPNTTEWAHLTWEIEHELETLIQFYRGTTYSDNGTIIPSFNRNGNSPNNATTLFYHSPTITNAGTLVGTIQQGAGKKAGGSDRQADEFILKQDTAYLIRITNLTVNDNLVFIKLNWYEHTSLN